MVVTSEVLYNVGHSNFLEAGRRFLSPGQQRHCRSVVNAYSTFLFIVNTVETLQRSGSVGQGV